MAQIDVIKGFQVNGKSVPAKSYDLIVAPKKVYGCDYQWAATVMDRDVSCGRKKVKIYFKDAHGFHRNEGDEVLTNDVSPMPMFVAEPMVETDSDICGRINEKFDVLRMVTEAVADNHIRALAVSGSPGTGKTHDVLKVLHDRKRIDPSFNFTLLKGTISNICLYATLWEAREKNNVVVLDDCDILGDMDTANTLKAAMDTTKRRTVSYTKLSSYLEEQGIPSSFEFEGGVIYLSNVDFVREVERKTKMSVHYEAFLSRSHFIDTVLGTDREKMIRVLSVMRDSVEFKDEHDLNDSDVEMMADWLIRYSSKLREISVRTAVKLSDLIKAKPESWDRIARVTLLK